MKCCKVCYTENFYPQPLKDSNLVTFANGLFKSQGLLYLEDFDSRHLLCFECRSQLWKSYTLVQKAACVQKAVQVLEQKRNITSKTWQDLRKQYRLFSTMGYHKVEINFCITADDQDPITENEVDLNDVVIKEELKVEYEYPGDIIFESIEVTKTDVIEQNCTEIDTEVSTIQTRKGGRKMKRAPVKRTIRKPNKIKSKVVDTAPQPVEHNVEGKRRQPSLHLADVDPALSDSDTENNLLLPRNKQKKTALRGTSQKKKKNEEEDYNPDASDTNTSDTDTSGEYLNNKGKRLRTPKRIYPRPCELCSSKMTSAKEHYRHYVIHHNEKEYPYKIQKAFMCEHCGKSYTTQRLVDHMRTHGDRRTIECLVCDKKIFTRKAMLSHVKLVHAEKKLICDYCGKAYSEKTALTLHIRTHTGQKPYKCHICGVGFAHGGNLLVHIRNIHQNINQSTDNRKEISQKTKRLKTGNRKKKEISLKKKKGGKIRKALRSSSDDNILLSCLKDSNVIQKQNQADH